MGDEVMVCHFKPLDPHLDPQEARGGSIVLSDTRGGRWI